MRAVVRRTRLAAIQTQLPKAHLAGARWPLSCPPNGHAEAAEADVGRASEVLGARGVFKAAGKIVPVLPLGLRTGEEVAAAIHRFTKLDWLISVLGTVPFVGGCAVVYGFGCLILCGKTWRGMKF